MQVECLADIGVPAQFVCMMASKAPGIVARTPEQLRAVADYVRGRGYEGLTPPKAINLPMWVRSMLGQQLQALMVNDNIPAS